MEEKKDHEKKAWRALQADQSLSAQYKTEAQEALLIKQRAVTAADEKVSKTAQMEKIVSQKLKSLEQVSPYPLRGMTTATIKLHPRISIQHTDDVKDAHISMKGVTSMSSLFLC